MRFLLIPGRTNKQGVNVNVGKDEAAYQEIVTTLTVHADDMKELGAVNGSKVVIRNGIGEAEFTCKEGNIPRDALRAVRPADLPTDGRQHGRHRHARFQRLGCGRGVDSMNDNLPTDPQQSAPDLTDPDIPAWEEIEAGRFMPRRIRGSFRGRTLG